MMVNQLAEGDHLAEKESTDVQTYLVSKYREALKNGDKSYAKSCLLSARLFSVNDPNITYEIYLMAKSDGDFIEAAKCFENLYNTLVVPCATEPKCESKLTNETLLVLNQMREEIRTVLKELKIHQLKLKSSAVLPVTNSSGQQTRQAPSVIQSPMLSPRLRMSSEDRSVSKESVLRLGSHLHSKTTSFFYQQMFDNLNDRKTVISSALKTCDNPIEYCRLQILSMILFPEDHDQFAGNLLKNLASLSGQPSEEDMELEILALPRSPIMCQYAKSMLILDAIPLSFSKYGDKLFGGLKFFLDELMTRALNYYSDNCLQNAAGEYAFDELHEGLKKTIAARILGKDLYNTSDDLIGESIISSMNLIMDRYFFEYNINAARQEKLKNIRSLITDKSNKFPESLDLIMNLIQSLDLDEDISDSILFEERPTSPPQTTITATTTTTPSKGRGRPKKVQQSVIVSPGESVRKQLESDALVCRIVFFSIVQYIFQLSLQYLRQTKSRILIRFDNPLADVIESKLKHSSHQRSSRSSRNASQEASSASSKKVKLELESHEDKTATTAIGNQFRVPKDSPLNSEQCKKLDREIVMILKDVYRCLEYLKSGSSTMSKLWNKFFESSKFDESTWFSRVYADSMLISGHFEQALNRLEHTSRLSKDEPQITRDPNDTETLTISTGSNTIDVKQIRASTQLISCYIQQKDSNNVLQSIDDLLSKIRLSGMLTNDGGYSTGNIIEEFMVLVEQTSISHDNTQVGFLFFNTLSLIRYVANILIDIQKRLVYSSQCSDLSDIVVGHSIVLCQLDWPKEAPLYERCIAWIRANKPRSTTPQTTHGSTKFTYSKFSQFITDPNIIEDFLALSNDGYTLDIISMQNSSISSSSSGSKVVHQQGSSNPSTSERTPTRASKTMTTRGVNKNYREQLKYMLIDQVKRSCTLVPLGLITNFIQVALVPSLRETLT